MIWAVLIGVIAAAMTPLLLSLRRAPEARGRREADLALYRAQLAELDREHAAGRLTAAAHRAAMLEAQRRLLGAPEDDAARRSTRSMGVVAASVFLIPAMGVGFYLWRGHPGLPAGTLETRAALAERDDELIASLRGRLAQMDPASETTRQGFLLLAQIERNRGRIEPAAEAYERALALRFDAASAADAAELHLERGDHAAARPLLARALAEQPGDPRLRFLVGLTETLAGRHANARNVWQALLSDTPPNAPWRPMLETRLRELP